MSDYIYIYDNINYCIENIKNFDKKKIIFGESFNLPIDNLPDFIEQIRLPFGYTHQLNNLPSGLIYLGLYSDSYEHQLNCLPENLKILCVGNNLKYQLDNLPNSLKVLHINGKYSHPLDNLPNNLEELKINEPDNISMNNLPDSIKILLINCDYHDKIINWPKSLKILHTNKYSHLLDNLPQIEELNISSDYKFPIDCIPDSIKLLNLHREYIIQINKLPLHLETVT